MVIKVYSTAVMTISMDGLQKDSVVSSAKLQMLKIIDALIQVQIEYIIYRYVEKQGSKHRSLRDTTFYFTISA